MRIVFAGTPAFAAVALREIVHAGFDVVLVLTQPDRPAGRGLRAHASAVKVLAAERGLPVFQPSSLREGEAQSHLAQARPDVIVVAAYGLIFPQAVLDLPPHGCLNIHASLLPRWRGAAPIQRALLAGDERTGVTIMRMDAGMDTGPMLDVRAVAIGPEDTAGTLHDRLAEVGAQAMVATLRAIERGEPPPAVTQPSEGATKAPKIAKEEARIDWTRPAVEIDRAVRAFDPFPGASTQLDGEELKVWAARVARADAGRHAVGGHEAVRPDGGAGTRAPAGGASGHARPGEIVRADRDGILVACGEGCLLVRALQRAGGRRLEAAQYLAGHPLAPGRRLGA